MLALVTGAPFTLRPPNDPYTEAADADARATDQHPDVTANGGGGPRGPVGSGSATMNRLRRFTPDDIDHLGQPTPDPTTPSGAARSTTANGTGPSTTGPQAAGAGGTGPSTTDSSTADLSTADPRTAGPDAAGSGSTGSGSTGAGDVGAAWPDGGEDGPAGGEGGPAGGGDGARVGDALPAGWGVEPPEEPDPGDGFQYRDEADADPIGVAGLPDGPLPARTGDGRVDLDRTPTPDQPHLCACGGVQPAARRGVVDLQVSLTTLMCLNDDPALFPGWGPVLADIARQVAFDQEANPLWRWSVTDEHGNLLHHGHTQRRPTAVEKAFVKARDRTCRAPGCRRPAMRCDDDHRLEYAKGGPSHRANLCVLCRHHHRLRHERGFIVHQIQPGVYLWEAPNGRLYMATPDGDLIQTADGLDPGPPPGHVRAALETPD